jgi:hypothetical protein
MGQAYRAHAQKVKKAGTDTAAKGLALRGGMA